VNGALVGAHEGHKYVVLTMCQAKESAIVFLKTEQPPEEVAGTESEERQG
jgi:hypothetical protein